MINLAALLTDHPFSDDELLLHTVDRAVTAGDARRAAASLADDLRQKGLHSGQAVAAQLPNGPEAVIAMLGTWMAECVWVPVNPRSPSHEVDRVTIPEFHLDDAPAPSIFTSRSLAPTRGLSSIHAPQAR